MPFRRRNPAESHLSISSRQGFWRRNLVHCALAAVSGASDHKFSKYDGMKAHSFVLCPNWHWWQIHAHILGGNTWRREKMGCTMALLCYDALTILLIRPIQDTNLRGNVSKNSLEITIGREMKSTSTKKTFLGVKHKERISIYSRC